MKNRIREVDGVKNRLKRRIDLASALRVSLFSLFFIFVSFFYFQGEGLGLANVIDCGPRFDTLELPGFVLLLEPL